MGTHLFLQRIIFCNSLPSQEAICASLNQKREKEMNLCFTPCSHLCRRILWVTSKISFSPTLSLSPHLPCATPPVIKTTGHSPIHSALLLHPPLISLSSVRWQTNDYQSQQGSNQILKEVIILVNAWVNESLLVSYQGLLCSHYSIQLPELYLILHLHLLF